MILGFGNRLDFGFLLMLEEWLRSLCNEILSWPQVSSLKLVFVDIVTF